MKIKNRKKNGGTDNPASSGWGKGRCHAAHLYKAGVSAEEKDYQ
jgi:hypothetical protein